MDKYLEVGKIVTTHGIKGELKVLPDTSFVETRFEVGNVLFIKKGKEFEPVKITSSRFHKNTVLITINNLTDINLVLGYVGLVLYVASEDLEELDENDFYYDDLIGLNAYVEGEVIGVVEDVVAVPQGELLKIKKLDQTFALIPFVNEFVGEVDIDNKKVIITPIEGLL